MGEYAKYRGDRVKIGTCEDMLYLRADQRHLVVAEHGNVDPVRDAERGIRFRFPFPEEDGIEPGAFENPFKRQRVDMVAPDGVEHHSVQFVADRKGYVVSLPCPEGPDADPRVHRNGFAGATFLVQQRMVEGQLVAVFECACGTKWRAPTLADAAPAVEGLLAEADRLDHLRKIGPYAADGPDAGAERLRTIALRIGAGYLQRAKVDA